MPLDTMINGMAVHDAIEKETERSALCGADKTPGALNETSHVLAKASILCYREDSFTMFCSRPRTICLLSETVFLILCCSCTFSSSAVFLD